MFRRLPIAWLQLTREKMRLVIAITGVAFATILMFMQLGFHDALFDNSALVYKGMHYDLAVINTQSAALFQMQNFSRRELYRLLAYDEVESVTSLYTDVGKWRNPVTGKDRSILVLGLDPSEPGIEVQGLNDKLHLIRQTDVCLFDEIGHPSFGPIVQWKREGKRVEVEVNRRRTRVAGLFRLGASFAADGNLIMTEANFLRFFPQRKAGAINVGLIRLKSPEQREAVQKEIASRLPKNLRVMTIPEMIEFEKQYWREGTAIGFVFTMGAAMGFFVGFVIVYQILYTDVSDHLPQYATLKAMGYTDGYLLKIVMQESVILSVLGFIPGILVSSWLYHLTHEATSLPIAINFYRSSQIFGLTLAMCALSGALAVRRLRAADPADVF
jgi:putative ABC transport system permease protein